MDLREFIGEEKTRKQLEERLKELEGENLQLKYDLAIVKQRVSKLEEQQRTGEALEKVVR